MVLTSRETREGQHTARRTLGQSEFPRAEMETWLSLFPNLHNFLSRMPAATSIFICPRTGYLNSQRVNFLGYYLEIIIVPIAVRIK